MDNFLKNNLINHYFNLFNLIFIMFFLSGKINEEGLYIIKYEDMFEYDWTLTLKKDGEKYKFVSNISDVS